MLTCMWCQHPMDHIKQHTYHISPIKQNTVFFVIGEFILTAIMPRIESYFCKGNSNSSSVVTHWSYYFCFLIAQSKTMVSQVLMYWRYHTAAVSHQFNYSLNSQCVLCISAAWWESTHRVGWVACWGDDPLTPRWGHRSWDTGCRWGNGDGLDAQQQGLLTGHGCYGCKRKRVFKLGWNHNNDQYKNFDNGGRWIYWNMIHIKSPASQ